MVAQIFPLRTAVWAGAAGRAEPWHAHALAELEPGDPRPDRCDPADDLVARHDGQGRIGQLAVDHVQIGATDSARRDLDQNFATRRPRNRPLAQNEPRVRPVQNHRAHG